MSYRKFIDPSEPRAKKLKPLAPANLNQESQLIDVKNESEVPAPKPEEPVKDANFQVEAKQEDFAENASRLVQSVKMKLNEIPIDDPKGRSKKELAEEIRYKAKQLALAARMLEVKDQQENEKEKSCRFCRNIYARQQLNSHEAACSQRIKCDFCRVEVAKDEYDWHLEHECILITKCEFCFNLFLKRDIELHLEECPDRLNCQFCGIQMKRIDLEDHIFKDCKKAKPGIRIDRHVDPRPYHEMKT